MNVKLVGVGRYYSAFNRFNIKQ